MEQSAVVACADVVARRGAFTLGPISCQFTTGSTVLVGPNGAGKTTLLELSQLAYSLVEPVWCPSLYGPTAPAVLLDRTSDVAAAIAARSALGPNATPPTPARKRQLQKELAEVSACR